MWLCSEFGFVPGRWGERGKLEDPIAEATTSEEAGGHAKGVAAHVLLTFP